MTITSANMIFIGNLSTIDNDESDWNTDDAAALQGTYDSSVMELTVITENDVDGSGAIIDDEGGTGDTVSYTTSSGSYSGPIDASILYNAIVTEADGTQTTTQVVVVQMPNGDTFVVDFPGGDSLDNMNISSIQLTSPHSTNYAGYYTGKSVDNTSVCFCSGTLIETTNGPAKIETLRPGDMVLTADHGPQELRWIGGQLLAHPGRNAPIEISPGAFGNDVPNHKLRVSPQHRMLVQSPIVTRMFGTDAILMPAKHLLDLPGVTQAAPHIPVRYWHMLFDHHEIVRANGAWAETLFLGPEAAKSISKAALNEILEIFGVSSLADLTVHMGGHVRPVPDNKRQKKLVQRQIANTRSWQNLRRPPAYAALS